MRLVQYAPEHFPSLRQFAGERRALSLAHRPFVDYYYANNPWCALHLLIGEGGQIAGTIGIDRMTFASGAGTQELGFASNFHAAQAGAGGYLFLHWLKTCSAGLVFGGSEQTHAILRRQRWRYFTGARTFTLNRRCHVGPKDPLWKRWAKWMVDGLRRVGIGEMIRRVPPAIRSTLTIHEEQAFSPEMLPARSPFAFRHAPSLEYLSWRYRPGLSFVRYRVFRLCQAGRTCGYVVLNELPDRLLVAQSDGEDAESLAWGIVLSVIQVLRENRADRPVLLSSSHPGMQAIFRRVGFCPGPADRPFAVGSVRGGIDLPTDPATWLLNFDWGDNGLRTPFLDEGRSPRQARPATAAAGV